MRHRFAIAADHPCLPGHFPGRPIVPGVVILEHVLAAIETTLAATSNNASTGALRLPSVKFMQPLLPGQHARIELDGVAPRWRFRVLRGADLLASGEVVLA